MADTLKHKMEETGHRIGERMEQAADWAKEKAHEAEHRMSEVAHKVEDKAKETFGGSPDTARNAADIREHMDVLGSCGNKVGRVDHVEGGNIKLTRNDSPDGRHHLIPMSWVERVDEQVHLDRDCGATRRDWQTV
jgi:hypothetical protein